MLIRYSGGQNGWVPYVLNGTAKNPRNQDQIKIIDGDLKLTETIYQSTAYNENYTRVVILFKGKQDLETMKAVYNDWKKEFLTGFGDDEYNISAIAHLDTDNHHIHICLPKYNLKTQLLNNYYYHKTDFKRAEILQSYLNAKYNLSDPNQKKEQDIIKPVLKEEWINEWRQKEGQKPLDFSVKKARVDSENIILNQIQKLIDEKIITNFDDLKQIISDFDLSIAKIGFDQPGNFHYFTVENETGKTRLKGEIFNEQHWNETKPQLDTEKSGTNERIIRRTGQTPATEIDRLYEELQKHNAKRITTIGRIHDKRRYEYQKKIGSDFTKPIKTNTDIKLGNDNNNSNSDIRNGANDWNDYKPTPKPANLSTDDFERKSMAADNNLSDANTYKITNPKIITTKGKKPNGNKSNRNFAKRTGDRIAKIGKRNTRIDKNSEKFIQRTAKNIRRKGFDLDKAIADHTTKRKEYIRRVREKLSDAISTTGTALQTTNTKTDDILSEYLENVKSAITDLTKQIGGIAMEITKKLSEIEIFKKDLSIGDFLLENGATIIDKKSTKNSLVCEFKGNRLIVSKSATTGHYQYFNIDGTDGGSIIDLYQNHIKKEPYGIIMSKLRKYFKTGTVKHILQPISDEERELNKNIIKRLQPLDKEDIQRLSTLRNFDFETINAFKSYIYADENHNFCFVHQKYDFNEKISFSNVGIEKKNKDWKGHQGEKGLWGQSIPGSNEIFIFESPFDAMAFYELHKKPGQYISTGGRFSPKQVESLKAIIQASKTKKINVCFDNDEAGNQMEQELFSLLQPLVVVKERVLSIFNDFNDDLKYFKLSDKEISKLNLEIFGKVVDLIGDYDRLKSINKTVFDTKRQSILTKKFKTFPQHQTHTHQHTKGKDGPK